MNSEIFEKNKEDCFLNCKDNLSSTLPINANVDPCRRMFSDEYLDKIEMKLERIKSISKKNMKKHQVGKRNHATIANRTLNLDQLWEKYSPYKKNEEILCRPKTNFKELCENEFQKKIIGSGLNDFLHFLTIAKV